jgi:hypothetical protein
MRIEEKDLSFRVIAAERTFELPFPVRRIICGGYSGRSQEAVHDHVRELQALGLPAPDKTPIFFQVSNYLATTGSTVTVQDKFTSGEVEFVLLFHGGETYVTCGSDHTHRQLERHSIPGAKQMHPKIFAREAWPLADLTAVWDRLTLRSWATVDDSCSLYQDSPLAHIMEREQLVDEAERYFKVREDGTIFMSGTIPTVGGKLVYADNFAFEMHDPTRSRTLRHSYDVVVMD